MVLLGTKVNPLGLFIAILSENIINPKGVDFMDDKRSVQIIIGNNLRKYRLLAKLTQDELAEKAGISTPFLANLERGSKGMSIHSLREFCKNLGVSADQLLFDPEPSNNIRNIEMLLKDQPEHVVLAAEKMIRILVDAVDTEEKDKA